MQNQSAAATPLQNNAPQSANTCPTCRREIPENAAEAAVDEWFEQQAQSIMDNQWDDISCLVNLDTDPMMLVVDVLKVMPALEHAATLLQSTYWKDQVETHIPRLSESMNKIANFFIQAIEWQKLMEQLKDQMDREREKRELMEQLKGITDKLMASSPNAPAEAA